MPNTANRIFTLLESKGKSQQALADYLGKSKQTISGWKNPKNKSYMDYIAKIAEFLEVPVGALLYDDEPLAIRGTKKEWEAILNRLSPESLKQLLDYTDYLVWKQDQASQD